MAMLAEILKGKIIRYTQQYYCWLAGMESQPERQFEWKESMARQADVRAAECFKKVVDESILFFR